MTVAIDRVVPYAIGFVSASVCAAGDATVEEVSARLGALHPTGLSWGWQLASEAFRTGESNPCPCNTDPTRRHWLLTC